MRLRRVDLIAAAGFAGVAALGLWLWTGTGPVVWLGQFAAMCGFG